MRTKICGIRNMSDAQTAIRAGANAVGFLVGITHLAEDKISKEDAKEIIESDFASVCDGGYLVVPAKVLNASEYGVPQGRERVIFFGFKKADLNSTALAELSKTVISSETGTRYSISANYITGNICKTR